MSDPVIPLADPFAPADEARWRRLVEKLLDGGDFDRRLVSRTADGLPIAPLYTRRGAVTGSATGSPAGPSAGSPGSAVRPVGRTDQGWDIRQRHAEPDATKSNTAILADLAGGVTSIALQIDSPGQVGLSYAAGPMAEALAGVLLDVCPITLDAQENTMDAAGSLIEIWRARDIGEERRRGAFDLDPLGTLARTGSLYYPAEKSLGLAARFAIDSLPMPGVTALAADGRPYHEAGGSEAQELAALLAGLVSTLRACEAEGLAPARATAKIALHLAADADLLLTIAKARALRGLVQRVGEACGAADAAARMPVTMTTSQRMTARRDPWVNMLRATAACAGAAFGGADAITVLPFTWPLGPPDAFALRIARNTQVVLQEEAGLGRVDDPAQGSFAIERLTAELAAAAWAEFQAIERAGGMAAALRSGFVQDRIAATAAARAKAIAAGRLEQTGVSAFPRLGDDGVTAAPWPAAAPLGTGGENVRRLAPRRTAEPFEALRDAADRHALRTGRVPAVFLAGLGPLAGHAARTTWIGNFLAAGGIAAITSEPLHQSAEAGRAFAASGAEIACLCGPDAVYAEIGEASAGALKSAGARMVYVAGRPKAGEAALKAAGVDEFIFAGCDMPAVLGALHLALGIGA
jgi:methylmalonyl-CoA mutase